MQTVWQIPASRLEMPVFPEDRFVDAVVAGRKSKCSIMFRLMAPALHFTSVRICSEADPVIGVKPANEYQFRIFATPVGPYFKGGAKPITIRVC